MFRVMTIAAVIALSTATFAGDATQTTTAVNKTEEKVNATGSDYRTIEFMTIDGAKTNLNAFKGKVVLVVNVASKCGFTPQYKGLEELYKKYKDRGVVVIGFPANNFGGQEPGTNEEIKMFCTGNYGVNFPMMAKISVRGDDIHPLYAYLTQKSPLSGEIQWNFNKFLLDQSGNVIARWPSKVEPMSTEITGKIEELLKGAKAKS